MQGCGIQTTGKGTYAGGNHQVIGSCQSGNAVQEDYNIHLVLYQTLRAFNHHFRYSSVVIGKLIKGRVNYFHVITLDSFLDISYFFRSLVN